MPAIGPQELIIILVILLLLFGAKKVPELARGIGKSLSELKKAREEFERETTLGPGPRSQSTPTSAREDRAAASAAPLPDRSPSPIDER